MHVDMYLCFSNAKVFSRQGPYIFLVLEYLLLALCMLGNFSCLLVICRFIFFLKRLTFFFLISLEDISGEKNVCKVRPK